MTTLLRPMVIAHLVSFDDEPTLAEAERLFRAHQAGTGTLHADLRSAAYRAVLKRGGRDEFDMMLKVRREGGGVYSFHPPPGRQGRKRCMEKEA